MVSPLPLTRFFHHPHPPVSHMDSPRTQKKTIETIGKIMKVALPTLAIIAATYIFLSHLPIVAMTISATTLTSALVISYYWIIKPLLLLTSSSASAPASPPSLEFPPRSGSQSVPADHPNKPKTHTNKF